MRGDGSATRALRRWPAAAPVVLLAACAHPHAAAPPAAARELPALPPPALSRAVAPPATPAATRGEISDVSHDWLGPDYFVRFDDGRVPPPGALLSVRRGGERVGTLVVVASGPCTARVLATSADGSSTVEILEIAPGPPPALGSAWRIVDHDGTARDGTVAWVEGGGVRFVRPSWDGTAPLLEHDTVTVTGHSDDAREEAEEQIRRDRYME